MPADQIPQGTGRLYKDLAEWWPLMSPPEEYEEEAAFYASLLLKDLAEGSEPTLLELGSGGGNNASFLKRHFQLTLVDPAAGMLAHSRKLNPEAVHLEGDMRTLRTGREYDRVFVHDAIMYMTTQRDLKRAMETAFVHCRRGGVALFAPDYVKETFHPGTECGGADGEAGGFRYLEWSWDPDPTDTTYVVYYAYLLRSPDGVVQIEEDRHVEGVFPREVWLRILKEVGFEAEVVPFDHSEVERDLEVFLARKP